MSDSSAPCLASNKSKVCPGGHWLCEDQQQCILRGHSFSLSSGREGFISNLCDGVRNCRDGSDERFTQCLQVIKEWQGFRTY